ncbi:MAG: hypothetical protein MJZ81_06235 [Bacteroidales bacterium]|nr:hypothetical protein [Bacteroidales bacterium]
MRINGLIYAMLPEGTEGIEFDIDGNPVAAGISWSEGIECSVQTVRDTRKGVYEDGNFRQASFSILVEEVTEALRNAGIVRVERLGEDLGEYRVMSIEPLETVGRVRIMV